MPNSSSVSKRKNSTIAKQEDAGKRIDGWLSQKYKYHSRASWQEEICKGLLTINGQKVKITRELNEGDVITYCPPPRPEPPVDLSYEIIFQDEDLLVINKSGNLPCHPSGCFYQNTLWFELKKKYDSLHFINRLDRETSGLVMIALNKKTAKHLAKQLQDHRIIKEYQLVVHGHVENDIAAIGWIGPDEESPVRKKRAFFLENVIDNPGENWEKSSTWFYPQRTNDNFTLLRVRLGTGRTHQIRATAESLGFPVVGDKIYGTDDSIYLRFIDKTLTIQDNRSLILNRQALHASALTFEHPTTKETIHLTAPIDQTLLRKLNL